MAVFKTDEEVLVRDVFVARVGVGRGGEGPGEG